jgi:hypothetical protein
MTDPESHAQSIHDQFPVQEEINLDKAPCRVIILLYSNIEKGRWV